MTRATSCVVAVALAACAPEDEYRVPTPDPIDDAMVANLQAALDAGREAVGAPGMQA